MSCNAKDRTYTAEHSRRVHHPVLHCFGKLLVAALLCECRRARAAWKAYEEHNLPLLRMEKPNLKASQYRCAKPEELHKRVFAVCSTFI
jgi:hypothetical protein